MPYINSIERIALRRGREEGREEGLFAGQLAVVVLLLEKVLGPLPEPLKEKVRALTAARLTDLASALLKFTSLRNLEAWLKKDK